MIKKILVSILIASSFANATKRINVSCEFNAIAVGYENLKIRTNLILKETYSDYLKKWFPFIYNDDGSDSLYRDKAISSEQKEISSSWTPFVPRFKAYDGNEYQHIYLDDVRTSNGKLILNKNFKVNLNSGTFNCIISEGWLDEYYEF